MRNVAFVTYNTLDGYTSGWIEANGRRALVLQNTNGEGSRRNGQPIGAVKRVEQIVTLWDELLRSLTELDHIVVYVGSRGSERAIALAGTLPASKVTFVACDCGLPLKEMLIEAAGLDEAGRFLCECGGHLTMAKLLSNFLESGELDPEAA